VGSIILGPVLALISMRVMVIMRQSGDTPTNIITQFIITFGVWLVADRLGLSGVLTIVTYAITAARQAPASTPACLRVPSYAVWETTMSMSLSGLVSFGIRPLSQSGSREASAISSLHRTI
jgi:monovalent cation/hydrogen antiporter